MFLIILAGLQSIPQEPIEAARVDGAGPVRVFFDHTLPLLMPVLMVAVVLRTIDAIGTFDQIYVLTKGGPGTSTQLISSTPTTRRSCSRSTAARWRCWSCSSRRADPDGRRDPLHAARGAGRRGCRASAATRLALILLVALFPLWWMLVTSFKRPVDIFAGVTLCPSTRPATTTRRLFDAYHFGSFLRTA